MEDGKFLESVGKRISRRGAEGSTGGTWEDELEGYYSAPPIGWVPTEVTGLSFQFSLDGQPPS